MREKIISGGLISILLINLSFSTSVFTSLYFSLSIVITIVGVLILSAAVHGVPGKVKLCLSLFVISMGLTLIQELPFKLGINEIFSNVGMSHKGIVIDILTPLLIGTVVVLSPFWILPLVGKWKLMSIFMVSFFFMVICITFFSILIYEIIREDFSILNSDMSLKFVGWSFVLIGVLVALFRKLVFIFLSYSMKN